MQALVRAYVLIWKDWKKKNGEKKKKEKKRFFTISLPGAERNLGHWTYTHRRPFTNPEFYIDSS